MAAAAALLMLRVYDPATSGMFPPCPVFYLTGWYCPGCGSLRALHQLLHGHLATAFRCNALLITALPFFGWFALRRYLLKPKQPPVLSAAHSPWWLWAALVVIVVFGIVRNLPFASLAWMRP